MDKLTDYLVPVIIIGVWLVQFWFRSRADPNGDTGNDNTHEGDTPFEGADRSRNQKKTAPRPTGTDYASDPYLEVQAEIRRKIAERQAAARRAAQPAKGPAQHHSPVQRHSPVQQPHAASHQRPTAEALQQPDVKARQQPAATRPAGPASAFDPGDNRKSAGWGEAFPGSKPRPAAAPKSASPAADGSHGRSRHTDYDSIPERTATADGSHGRSRHTFEVATPARSSYFPTVRKPSATRTVAARNAALRQLLHRNGSLREAVLLREILDRPLALRQTHGGGSDA